MNNYKYKNVNGYVIYKDVNYDINNKIREEK